MILLCPDHLDHAVRLGEFEALMDLIFLLTFFIRQSLLCYSQADKLCLMHSHFVNFCLHMAGMNLGCF